MEKVKATRALMDFILQHETCELTNDTACQLLSDIEANTERLDRENAKLQDEITDLLEKLQILRDKYNRKMEDYP